MSTIINYNVNSKVAKTPTGSQPELSLDYGTTPVWSFQLLSSSGTPYTGLADLDLRCRAVVKKDYTRQYPCQLSAALEVGAITVVTVTGLKQTPPDSGELMLTKDNDQIIVEYSDWIIEDGVYAFIVDAALTDSYGVGETVQVAAAALIETGDDLITVDAATGLVTVPLDTVTTQLRDLLSGASDGREDAKFELQIKLKDVDEPENEDLDITLIPIRLRVNLIDALGYNGPEPASLRGKFITRATPLATKDNPGLCPASIIEDVEALKESGGSSGGSLAKNLIYNSALNRFERRSVSDTSDTVTLAAYQYGHDRFRAGADGCTYTVQSVNGCWTTFDITAGSLQQVIPVADVVGGDYVLAWSGTAQARVNGAEYAASPLTISSLAAGSRMVVEWSSGTLAQPQLIAGDIGNVVSWSPQQNDHERCMRYYQKILFAYANAAIHWTDTRNVYILQAHGMRRTPDVQLIDMKWWEEVEGETDSTLYVYASDYESAARKFFTATVEGGAESVIEASFADSIYLNWSGGSNGFNVAGYITFDAEDYDE